jgi:uncharacterized protein YbaP (TraB family)
MHPYRHGKSLHITLIDCIFDLLQLRYSLFSSLFLNHRMPHIFMKKTVFPLVVIFISTVSLLAQSSVWKISKNQQELYLSGTIHLLRTQDLPLPAEFDMAYEASTVAVFETDISQLQTPDFQQKLMAKAVFPGDSTLMDVLNEETTELLEKHCTKVGLSIEMVKKMRPSILVLTLATMEYAKLGMDTPGVDVHYFDMAKKDEKQTDFLESVDEQIGVITGMGKGNEDAFVRRSLDDLQNVASELPTMIDSWKIGSDVEMSEELIEMENDYPALYRQLIVARNDAWLPKIEAYMKTAPVEFVLVGNAHLHGKDGLLAVLQSRGYQIDQLSASE